MKLTGLSCVINLKASAQIRAKSSTTSSIILALTDGKLEVYVHELTVKEVRLDINLPCCWCATCWIWSENLFVPQADEARKYGARVYCVGIKDFDEQQVSTHATDRRLHVRTPALTWKSAPLKPEIPTILLLLRTGKDFICKGIWVYLDILLRTHVSVCSSHPKITNFAACGVSLRVRHSHLNGPAGAMQACKHARAHKSVQHWCMTICPQNALQIRIKSILICLALTNTTINVTNSKRTTIGNIESQLVLQFFFSWTGWAKCLPQSGHLLRLLLPMILRQRRRSVMKTKGG